MRKGRSIIEIQAYLKIEPHLVSWGNIDERGEDIFENHGDKLQIQIFVSNLGDADVLITDISTDVLENFTYKFIEKPMVLKASSVNEIDSDGTYDGSPYEEPFRRYNLSFIQSNQSELLLTTHNGKIYKSKFIISAQALFILQ